MGFFNDSQIIFQISNSKKEGPDSNFLKSDKTSYDDWDIPDRKSIITLQIFKALALYY